MACITIYCSSSSHSSLYHCQICVTRAWWQRESVYFHSINEEKNVYICVYIQLMQCACVCVLYINYLYLKHFKRSMYTVFIINDKSIKLHRTTNWSQKSMYAITKTIPIIIGQQNGRRKRCLRVLTHTFVSLYRCTLSRSNSSSSIDWEQVFVKREHTHTHRLRWCRSLRIYYICKQPTFMEINAIQIYTHGVWSLYCVSNIQYSTACIILLAVRLYLCTCHT